MSAKIAGYRWDSAALHPSLRSDFLLIPPVRKPNHVGRIKPGNNYPQTTSRLPALLQDSTVTRIPDSGGMGDPSPPNRGMLRDPGEHRPTMPNTAHRGDTPTIRATACCGCSAMAACPRSTSPSRPRSGARSRSSSCARGAGRRNQPPPLRKRNPHDCQAAAPEHRRHPRRRPQRRRPAVVHHALPRARPPRPARLRRQRGCGAQHPARAARRARIRGIGRGVVHRDVKPRT